MTLDVAVGQPHEEIARTAERLGCDVIVMGAHGRTGANKLMFGSTTHRILARSPLPVLATPPVRGTARGPAKGWPGKLVIAPIDIGPSARPEAVAAAVVARELGTQLELVHVVEPISGPLWLEVDADRRNLQRQRRATARLTQLQDELEGVATAVRVESGKPADRNCEDRLEQARQPRRDDPSAWTRVVRPAAGLNQLSRYCAKPTRRFWRCPATRRGCGVSFGGVHESEYANHRRNVCDRRAEHRHVGRSGPTPQLSRVMRAKLAHSQAILGAVVTSNWAVLDRESRALALAVRDPAWGFLRSPNLSTFVRATRSHARCRI